MIDSRIVADENGPVETGFAGGSADLNSIAHTQANSQCSISEPPMPNSPANRRLFLKSVAALGVGNATFQRALAAQVDSATPVTAEMVQQAEWIAGLTLTDDERKKLAQDLTNQQRGMATMRAIPLANSVPPALSFNPAPSLPPAVAELHLPVEPIAAPTPQKPNSKDDVAFLPISFLCR